MNIISDLIIPPIIVGVLITMIIGTNMLLTNSTSEVLVTHQLQSTANNTIVIVKEEVRSLKRILTISNSTMSFVESDLDTVYLSKNGEYLNTIRVPFGGGAPTNNSYFLRLDSLSFQTVGGGGLSPTFLRVTSLVKSSSNQQTFDKLQYKAVAQQDIYLTNLHLSN
tara:strand:- start:41021 stop:41518 length:498 start_codon:yes stop_codon:yes gene_type:complete